MHPQECHYEYLICEAAIFIDQHEAKKISFDMKVRDVLKLMCEKMDHMDYGYTSSQSKHWAGYWNFHNIKQAYKQIQLSSTTEHIIKLADLSLKDALKHIEQNVHQKSTNGRTRIDWGKSYGMTRYLDCLEILGADAKRESATESKSVTTDPVVKLRKISLITEITVIVESPTSAPAEEAKAATSNTRKRSRDDVSTQATVAIQARQNKRARTEELPPESAQIENEVPHQPLGAALTS